MKRWVWGALGAGLLGPVVCQAQLAPPQWRQPGFDSTHVQGTAVKVMPEYVAPPPAGQTEPPATVKAPTTISELLTAWNGVLLSLPGNEQLGAHGQIRFVITPAKAQLQFTMLWNWYDGCALTASNASCSHGTYRFSLSPEGLFAVRLGCGSEYGNAGGSAEFKWTDFVAAGGLSGAAKQWPLMRDSFWSTCYSSSGSND